MARALLKKEADPALLSLCAQEVEDYICSYCGVTALPQGAEAAAARMLADLLEGEQVGGGVKALSRGDYSVSFALSGEGEGVRSFDRRLNAFRKVKW